MQTSEPSGQRQQNHRHGLKEHNRKRNLDLIISHTAQSAAKAVAAVKAERSRQRTEKVRKQVAATNAETARLARLTKAVEARTAELQRRVAEAEQEHTALANRTTAMSAQVDQMLARLADGNERVRQSAQVEATREAARRGRERDELLWKAGQVSDPILREAYLAKANGDNLDDDD